MQEWANLRIGSGLLRALHVSPAENSEPTTTLVLAAALQSLALGLGLADRGDPEQSAVRSSGLPPQAFQLLDHYIGSNGAVASDEEVRDGLYDALIELAGQPETLRNLNKTKPLTGDELLTFAQIYWNLDADGARRKLPIAARQMRPNGQLAYIKVDAADEDYAELVLNERARRTPGYSSGGGAYQDRSARIAAAVAQLLVDRDPVHITHAKFRLSGTGRGEEWAVIWASADTASRATSDPSSKNTSRSEVADPTLNTLRQHRQAHLSEGRHVDAAVLCTTLIAYLRARADENPGDHESQLFTEYLQAGLTYERSNRSREALDHFANAERIGRTLSGLKPKERMHRFRLAATRQMQGVLLIKFGRAAEAEEAAAEAVGLSQALTDEDGQFEEILAASLSTLGMVLIQAQRPRDASPALNRALSISRKQVKNNVEGLVNQLHLANVLALIGLIQFQEDDAEAAENFLAESRRIGEHLVSSSFETETARLQVAMTTMLLGMVHLTADRYEAAEQLFLSTLSYADESPDAQFAAPNSLIVVNARFALGVLYGLTDREAESETSLLEAANDLRSHLSSTDEVVLGAAHHAQVSQLLGTCLFFLSVLYLGDERLGDAEGALSEAIVVLEAVADRVLLPQALDVLISLLQDLDRSAQAEHFIERRQQLDSEAPEGL